jgi:hypothetical protein
MCTPGAGTNECSNILADCVVLPPVMPSADNLVVTPGSYCTGIQGTGIAYFQWNYRHGGSINLKESTYRIQIDNNSDFSSPEVDRTITGLSNDPGYLNQQQIFAETVPTSIDCQTRCPLGTDKSCSSGSHCNYINYSQTATLYWRIKVTDSVGNSSSWNNGPNYQQKGHPAPVIVYAPVPYNLMTTFPAPGDTVQFVDTSTCFNNSGTTFSCKTLNTNDCTDGNCYTWNFSDNNLENGTNIHILGDVTHKYGTAKPAGYMSSLKVCDDIGCCISYENIPVKNKNSQELPTWKEISPF